MQSFVRPIWRNLVSACRILRSLATAAALLSVATPGGADEARPPAANSGQHTGNEKTPNSGLIVNTPQASAGYTLIFPLQSKNTYLIDINGNVVHTWTSKYDPGQEAYLLENGNLLRPAKVSDEEALFAGAGGGGRVQEFTWDGYLVWDYKFHNELQTQHHAITRMPNGNLLLIVWEKKSPAESIAAGVKPSLVGRGDVLVDAIYEVKPQGADRGEIVWQWHMWDHLVQDHDSTKANYGDVAAHPELIDANFARDSGFAALARAFAPPSKPPAQDAGKSNKSQDEALDRLKGLGYVGATGAGRSFKGFLPDWAHVNAVAYNPKLDQILLSSRTFSEIWIIDHSTTTEEAAGHTGGRRGKGGDLLYRWGNPLAYRAGKAKDQQLFTQHDAHWIAEGLPGAGNLLVFNNGGRPTGNYSSIDEIVLPSDANGDYARPAGAPFGPAEPVWSYTSAKKTDFFAALMSGAQRLPNGNTLCCTGFGGAMIEVTPSKEVAWKYLNPDKGIIPAKPRGAPSDGKQPNFGPPGAGRFGNPGAMVAAFLGGRGAGGAMFRAYRYAPEYAGLAGRDLTPGPSLVELVDGVTESPKQDQSETGR
jgi:hypothetical protein